MLLTGQCFTLPSSGFQSSTLRSPCSKINGDDMHAGAQSCCDSQSSEAVTTLARQSVRTGFASVSEVTSSPQRGTCRGPGCSGTKLQPAPLPRTVGVLSFSAVLGEQFR